MTYRDIELQDEYEAQYGDPRRCPHHPSEVTSSPDGMHDAPCRACEGEGEEQWHADMEAERRAAMTQAERDAEDAAIVARNAATKAEREADIDDTPF